MKKINSNKIINVCIIILGFIATTVLFTQCKKDAVTPSPTPPPASTSGQGMFWTSSDLGCGNITVTIGSNSRVINGFYNTSIPACGATSTATFDLSIGTYSYTASCSGGKTWAGSLTITAGGCTKIELTNSGSSSATGQAMFWIATDLGCGNINIVCNGITRTISTYTPSAPACGTTGFATFDLSPGSYSYTASCISKTWNGTITVVSGNCSKYQLTGGTSTTGQGMLWIASDLGCGNITVVCNGINRTISNFYATSPTCGASGCATFDLSPGSYTYSASCTGKTWSGTITITAGGCSAVRLT